MNQKFYIGFNNNINKKIIFLIFKEEKINDCWYLEERTPILEWFKCRDVFKEIPCFEISKSTYFKLRKLNEWERHQINKFVYYIDLFKYWGIYEELCEGLI
jgi:hypothetical protein